MSDNISDLMLAAISKPVAFFSSEGLLTSSNNSWDIFFQKQQFDQDIMFYDDILETFSLSPMQENDTLTANEVSINQMHLRVIRHNVHHAATPGIIVELEDISTSVNSHEMTELFTADTIYNIRMRISTIQNVFTLFTDYESECFTPDAMELMIQCRCEAWILERQLDNQRYLMQTNTGKSNLAVKFEAINLNNTIKLALQKIEPLINSIAAKPQITVNNYNVPPIMSDRNILTHVLITLLSNALYYNDHTDPVSIDVSYLGSQVRLSVSDTGWGIPSKEQASIFSYNFRGAKAKTSEYIGLGTELYIARKLLDMTGSNIEFTSVENKGTLFTIIFNDIA